MKTPNESAIRSLQLQRRNKRGGLARKVIDVSVTSPPLVTRQLYG
jgi:hypothetical protein